MLAGSQDPLIFRRHPFVWLVEAADDICYNIIDLEDAHRLNIIEHNECRNLLLNLIESAAIDNIEKVRINLDKIKDKNDQIAYLRAKSIHGLTMRSVDIYKNKFDNILSGQLKDSFFDIMTDDINALEEIVEFSYDKIYNHRAVVEIENAGYNVMNKLLSHFIPPILIDRADRTKSEKKAISLIPNQFLYETEPVYNRVMGVLDYVSGMTDNYATDLYRKIQGIDIGMTI